MPELRRLFFAISLPAKMQRQLVLWRADSFAEGCGKPVAAANLHMTLAFIGEVSAEKQHVLTTLAGRIRQPGFTLTLDDAGHWPRPGVLWLGCRQPPRGLLQLADLLRSQAARNGCYQNPQPFHPHITVYRHASQQVNLPPPGFSWSYEVEKFSLFESTFNRGRTRYTALQSWDLIKG